MKNQMRIAVNAIKPRCKFWKNLQHTFPITCFFDLAFVWTMPIGLNLISIESGYFLRFVLSCS
jgi:hypothetical protein